MRCWRALLPATLLVVAACTSGAQSAAPIELRVFAAASLADAIAVAKDVYLASLKKIIGSPATTITISTDSSSALRTQIEQGAPADVFLAADTVNPQKLVDAGLTDGDAVAIAANELALIVPSGNPADIRTPADLARPNVKVIAAGAEVPITRYAEELVSNLAAIPGYPDTFEAAYAQNVVSREDNVRAVVAKIELEEADAGIVYVTDATAAADRVEAIPVPPGANVRATYHGVVVKGSMVTRQAAHGFLTWLAGPGGQRVLADFGFLPPGL